MGLCSVGYVGLRKVCVRRVLGGLWGYLKVGEGLWGAWDKKRQGFVESSTESAQEGEQQKQQEQHPARKEAKSVGKQNHYGWELVLAV